MRICLYGASSDLIHPEYIQAVEALGEAMAQRGHTLVFGGGAQGLMGAAARGMTRGGGRIIGVAPHFFNEVDGVLYKQCTEFIYTDTMRQRKAIMEEQAEAFVTVPGGIGTFEEYFEILTLRQLGRHNKPIAIYNLRGYYDTLNSLVERAIEENFMKPACRALSASFTEPEALLDYLQSDAAADLDVRHFKNI